MIVEEARFKLSILVVATTPFTVLVAIEPEKERELEFTNEEEVATPFTLE